MKFKKYLALLLVATTVITNSVTAFAANWEHNSTGWWYNLDDGTYAKSELKDIGDKTYYFESNGYMKTGWKLIDGNWYYFDGSGAMVKNGWKWIGNDCYYFYEDGHMASNETVDGSYVNASGAWKTDNWASNYWGWWYNLKEGGYATSQFRNIGGKTYYFGADGYMVTGWKVINGKWYYFNSSGDMAANCWKWINGSCYYFYADGHMASNEVVDGSYVNASGAWKTDNWDSNSRGWWYNLKEGGYATSQFRNIGGKTYYFGADGYMVTGWKVINGKWYYFNSSGDMAANCWKWINGNCYYFYIDGHMASKEVIDGSYVNASGAWDPSVKGHVYEKNTVKKPTCTEKGLIEYTCKYCGDTYTKQVPATGHNYGEWIVDKKPTEKADGHRYKQCANCGHRIEETIPKLNHDHKAKLVKGKAATCTEYGTKDYYFCEGCGKKFSDSQCKHEVTDKDLVIKATGHDYKSEMTKAPTCTEEGIITYTCKNCSHNYTEKIKPTGHEYELKTKVVHHEEEGHWHIIHHEAVTHTEQRVVEEEYDEEIWEIHDICHACYHKYIDQGYSKEEAEHMADLTASGEDYDEHLEAHALKGEEIGYSTGQVLVDIIHHEAVVKDVIVVDKEAYDEKKWVVDKKAYDETIEYYECKHCGHTKSK